MSVGRGEKVGLVFVVASFVLAAVLYPQLPDPVPTHWSKLDHPDGWTPKPFGALLHPVVMTFVWTLLFGIGRVFRGELRKFERPWQTLFGAVMGFLFVVTSVGQLFAIDRRIPLDRVIAGCGGLLLMVLGNLMGKLTRNFIFGIRTPWTLASDEVWVRTHQLGGKLMVLAGGLLALSAAAGWWLVPSFVAFGLVLVATVIYSRQTYRRLEGAKPAQPNP